MSMSLQCPESARWQALLRVPLSEADQDRYERHLESCPACREQLDALGADHDELLQLARQVGDPTLRPADPMLMQVQQRLLDSVSAVRSEPPDLYFLRPAERPDLLGTLGDYQVSEVIGTGGMGIVLRGFDPVLQRPVAIKVLASALAGSPSARKRFMREGRAAAAVCHDHIVIVHRVAETDGLPYLVMEYLPNGSLQDLLDHSGPLQVEEVVGIGIQIASGLAAAHAQGLIHRDIKPANLLLEGEPGPVRAGSGEPGPVRAGEGEPGPVRAGRGEPGPVRAGSAALARVKITDFGLARMVDDVGLTQQGVVAGTPEYMSPEQARGEPVDHRGDLFSLGSVLYACCTGLAPFRANTALAVLRAVCEEEPAPIRLLNPDIPIWLETLIMRLLAKRPADRFPDAAVVASLLERYLAHLHQPSSVPPPDLSLMEHSAARTRPGWRSRLLGAVLLMLGIAGIAWQLAGGPDGSGAQTPPGQEVHEPLRGQPADGLDWKLVGSEADRHVHFEADGLRITLRTDNPRKRDKAGLSLATSMKGNFDATVHYEILKEVTPPEAGKEAANFYLVAILDRQPWTGAGLTHKASAEGGIRFWSWSQGDLAGKETQIWGERFPASAKSGRLRLVRNGPNLQYHVSEGSDADFTLLREIPFPAEALKEVRLIGSTGGPGAEIDVRFTDLRLRSGLTVASVPEQENARWSLWLMVGLFGLVLSGGLVLGLRRWKGLPPADTPASVSFPCSACGKNLKARAGLAGKKVKCPQCGQSVCVPEKDEGAP